MADKLGMVVEGSVSIPADYPPVGEVVSAKTSAQVTGTEALPIRRNVLVVRGYLLVALTYTAESSPHSLSYLKLRLPFANYIPHLTPDDYTAKIIYHYIEPQHSRSLYYSVALELERGCARG